ncbi:MAG: hypothetical protein HY731_03585 [Candidatus Tectomicrobia bacterium]|nr:hypothetical protein [Candidatus Tectomicrobia bacterium]
MEEKKYRQAALTYLIYGLIYMGGAIYITWIGAAARAMREGAYIWFALGSLLIVIFPWLIAKRWEIAIRTYPEEMRTRERVVFSQKWFACLLALLLLVRIWGLIKVMIESGSHRVPMPWGAELPLIYGAIGFLIITALTCYMLLRAVWDL